MRGVDLAPAALRRVDQLERHRDASRAGAGSLGHALAKPHGGERGLVGSWCVGVASVRPGSCVTLGTPANPPKSRTPARADPIAPASHHAHGTRESQSPVAISDATGSPYWRPPNDLRCAHHSYWTRAFAGTPILGSRSEAHCRKMRAYRSRFVISPPPRNGEHIS